jgi:hypothetical protein
MWLWLSGISPARSRASQNFRAGNLVASASSPQGYFPVLLTTAVGIEAANALPLALLAITVTTNVRPSSAETTR